MPFIRCKKFLCLPLVAAASLLAFLGIIVGSAGAVGGWINVINVMGKHPLPVEDQVGLFVFAITFTLLALLSLPGYSITVFYKKSALGHLPLIIAAFGLSLFSAIRPKDNTVVERCLGDSRDYLAKQLCAKGISLVLGLRIGVCVAALIIQLCTLRITCFSQLISEIIS
ncbi:hypothetical protein L218DRAFT_148441 [Marasmius fiardii PR-910]|nr:hypothetical protein L218DRAFT_148441 [Marasmius fiardii PR-910]